MEPYVDREQIINHEVGHTLGLGHNSDSTDVMYASVDEAIYPDSDDLGVLANLYP